jgi:transposase
MAEKLYFLRFLWYNRSIKTQYEEGEMAGYIKGKDRNQLSFGFGSLDDMVDAENSVRAIDAIVDMMEGVRHMFIYSTPATTGRPPHDPMRMFKLYCYCYFEKIRSSRNIEKECTRNVEAMWLMDGIVPDHKCIADFRRNNSDAIKAAFAEFTALCVALGLLDGRLVAIDGSKFRANNSRRKNITVGKVKKKLKYYREKMEEYLCELDENDAKVEKTRGKIEELETLVTTMEEQGIKEISLTDPDSRLMELTNKGKEVSYNSQIVVEGKNHIIVATDVTNSPADQGQLYNMAKQAVEVLGATEEDPLTALADKGYFEGEDIKKCEEDPSINAIVARPDERGNEGYQKSKFKYDSDNDHYICPQGQVLHRVGKKERNYVNRKACRECVHRDKCTKSQRGRLIQRGEYEEAMEASVKRFGENLELYRQRQMIVEHPFGTIKRTLGFTYFLTRELDSVRTENYLHMLTYNIKRVLGIFGTGKLLIRLEELRADIQGGTASFIHIFSQISFLHRRLPQSA